MTVMDSLASRRLLLLLKIKMHQFIQNTRAQVRAHCTPFVTHTRNKYTQHELKHMVSVRPRRAGPGLAVTELEITFGYDHFTVQLVTTRP